jgi:hypothetical protein
VPPGCASGAGPDELGELVTFVIPPDGFPEMIALFAVVGVEEPFLADAPVVLLRGTVDPVAAALVLVVAPAAASVPAAALVLVTSAAGAAVVALPDFDGLSPLAPQALNVATATATRARIRRPPLARRAVAEPGVPIMGSPV